MVDANAKREIFERRALAGKAGGFAVERLVLRCRMAIAGARSTWTR